MKCRDIMKTDVITCKESDSAKDCAMLMREHNIGFLPVCDDSQKVVGTITDRDLTIRLLAEGKDSSCRVGECMTSDVVSCSPDDDLEVCIRKMAEKRKSRMLVLADGNIAGVISLSDIAQFLGGDRSGEVLRDVSKRESDTQRQQHVSPGM